MATTTPRPFSGSLESSNVTALAGTSRLYTFFGYKQTEHLVPAVEMRVGAGFVTVSTLSPEMARKLAIELIEAAALAEATFTGQEV